MNTIENRKPLFVSSSRQRKLKLSYHNKELLYLALCRLFSSILCDDYGSGSILDSVRFLFSLESFFY